MVDDANPPNEHPNEKILRQDRAKEDDLATAVLKDYHTVVTYVGAGALGFFLTIHEKFFQLQDGKAFWLFIVSLILLFLSLLLYLVTVLFDFFGHSGLRDLMDDDIRTIDFDSASQKVLDTAEQKLIKKWERGENISRMLMFARLGMVVFGIAAEVIFIAWNISATKSKKEESAGIRVEIPARGDSTTIIIDTSGKSNIQIRFQNH